VGLTLTPLWFNSRGVCLRAAPRFLCPVRIWNRADRPGKPQLDCKTPFFCLPVDSPPDAGWTTHRQPTVPCPLTDPARRPTSENNHSRCFETGSHGLSELTCDLRNLVGEETLCNTCAVEACVHCVVVSCNHFRVDLGIPARKLSVDHQVQCSINGLREQRPGGSVTLGR